MKRLGALMLDRSLDSGRRRTDEQAQLGNGALTLRFIGDRKSFNGVGYLQEVDRDRGRIGVHGKTDGTGRGIARNRAISVAVGSFQTGHEQSKHNADQRDQADQLPGLELTGSGLHGRLRRSKPRTFRNSAYSNFHSFANVCFTY